jgi:hypothetical protein
VVRSRCALLADARLGDLDVGATDIATRFRDFDDYGTISSAASGQRPASGYVMALDEPGRDALREGLPASLLSAPDGSVRLVAHAWAVRGRRPA